MTALPPLPDTPLGHYRHYKGGEYEVIGVARHSETHEPLVVYRPLAGDGGWWVRPHAMFFETVDVDGARRPRFAPQQVRPAAGPVQAAALDLALRWQQAWNRHDVSDLPALMTADADWVTVGGKRLVGREQVVSVHEQLHAGVLAGTAWANGDCDAKAVAAGAAVVHLGFAVHGERDADGTPRPPRHGHFTWLLVDDGGTWRIRAAQGTNLAGPPPAAR